MNPLIAELNEILSLEQFLPNHYSRFESVLSAIHEKLEESDIKEGLVQLRKAHSHIRTNETMQGMAFAKIHGYAGDFEIIDKIYTEWKSDNTKLRYWDDYFHSQDAPKAVRNRKAYFIEVLNRLCQNKRNDKISVLNLASGPCRDLRDFFEQSSHTNIEIHCLEIDEKAIQYSHNILGEHKNKVHFINQNIFRFIPNQSYDLIWSAGLFDYFDDQIFIKLISRFLSFRNPGAEIVIGNFTDANPTMPYMEIIGEWFLNCRNEAKLKQLALQAGADSNLVTVQTEPSRVNLFLHIK